MLAPHSPAKARAATSHGVNLDFILFDNGGATTMNVDLSGAYAALQTVVTWARNPGNFVPTPSFRRSAMPC